MGYADTLRASGFFPNPWQGSPNVTFIGNGPAYDSGAIRIDNTGTSNITVNDVVVLLHGPGGTTCTVGNFCNPPVPINIWGSNITIQPGHKLILAQTAQYNFDTSDNPLNSCGTVSGIGVEPFPRVNVTISGVTQTFNDTAHVLDTLGYDVACRGNESEQWRPIGTFAGNPELTITPFNGTNPVGTPHTVTATLISNATGLPIANSTVNITVTGANTAFGTCKTNNTGICMFTYTGINPGLDTIIGSATVSGLLIHSPPAFKLWKSGFVIPELPVGTILTVLIPIAALIVYTRRESLTNLTKR